MSQPSVANRNGVASHLTRDSGIPPSRPPSITSWKEHIEWLVLKYASSFLASRKPLSSMVHTDPIIRPHGRLVPHAKERRFLLAGRVPQIPTGIKMGIQGNRNHFPENYLTPIRDGESIQDVLSLESMKGEIDALDIVWNNQLIALRELDRLAEKKADSLSILDAPLRLDGLVKKSNGKQSEERIEIIWEKFSTIDRSDAANIFGDRNPSNVKKGSFYLPSVLDYGASPYCEMVNDVLVQHEMYDDHSHLIPPWQTMNEIRPGSIMLVIGVIYERNIEYTCNGVTGYIRSYEIRGSWAKVLKRGRGHPLAFPCVPHPLHMQKAIEEKLAISRTLTDYDGFKSEKNERVMQPEENDGDD